MNALRIAVGVMAVVAVGCSSNQPTCTAGQVLKNGACVAEVTCGAGTTAVNGACVADLTCAAGTRPMNGMCVPEVTCGAGTTAMNGACVPDLVCGPGTRPMNGVCAPICANGTMSTDGGCVPDVVCGAGTTAMNGRCVPNVTCGTGTVAAGGSCVPDGTVVCTQGTRFDMASGTCVVDPMACANGTTLVGTVCTPDDELLRGAANVVEVEPTDGGNISGTLMAANFDAGVTFYGCINAPNATTNDVDLWTFTTTEPMVLDVRVDGIGGLSGGFAVIPGDAALQSALPGFARIGVNFTGDTSQREVYLPLPGTWGLRVDDSRALLTGSPVGTATTCYFATVRRRPLPTPTTAIIGMPQQVNHDGRVQAFTFTAAATGDLFDAVATSTSQAVIPGLVIMNATFVREANGSNTSGPPAHVMAGGLSTGEVATLILDPYLNYGVGPIDYTLDLASITAQALPVVGTMAMFTKRTASPTPWRDWSYFFFDVAQDNTVVVFNLFGSAPLDMAVTRADAVLPDNALNLLALIDSFGNPGRVNFANEPIRFRTAGRYYFIVDNPTAPPATVGTLTSTLITATVNPVALGTPVANISMTANTAFFGLDMTNPVWVEYGVTSTTNWGTGSVVLSHYFTTAEGWLRVGPGTTANGNVFPVFSGTQPSVMPFAPRGRVHLGETSDDFVIRVTSSAALNMGANLSVLVQNRPNVVNLGLLPASTPVVNTPTNVTSGVPVRFIARARAADGLRVTATPMSPMADVRMERLDANETVTAVFNAFPVGGAETLAAFFGAPPTDWVAWTVGNLTVGVPTDVSVTSTATPPRPYVITTGTLPFVDACSAVGGVTLGTNQDDQIFSGQMLPMPFTMFRFFGQVAPMTYRIAANGWMSFDTGTVSVGAYQNRQIPSGAAPNGLFAPFWQDQDSSTMCRVESPTGDTITVQWTGNIYQTSQRVQYQAVVHATGVIDFIYGPMHAADGQFADTDGNGATVGLEDLGGLFGHQHVYNQPLVLPNTSVTFTPM